MEKRNAVKRVASEFLLIVVGVVAALGIDRWVQGVDDAEMERDYLERVLADVSANAEIFARLHRDWDGARDASTALLTFLSLPDVVPDSVELFVHVARAGAVNASPARDGTFRDLETTGNLRLISDPELRAAIVEYFGHGIRVGRPFMNQRLDLRFRVFSREQVPAVLAENFRRSCPPPSPAGECGVAGVPSAAYLWADLLGDTNMPELLNARLRDTITGLRSINDWVDATGTLRGSLESALDH